MEFSVRGIGIIKGADIKIDGLTVIAGSNNSGKTTVGRALYSIVNAVENLEEKQDMDQAVAIVDRILRILNLYRSLLNEYEYVMRDCGEERNSFIISILNLNHMPVREKLVELQKQLAAKENVIMDGRDIGTCVLPDAQVKIYLTASVATRAKRRYDELTAKGTQCNLEEIEKDIEDRDYRDMHRETSPLKQAKDAVLVDSSEMNIDEVVDAIYQIYARV